MLNELTIANKLPVKTVMKQPTKHAKSGSSVEVVNKRWVGALQFFGQPKIIVTVIKLTKLSPQKIGCKKMANCFQKLAAKNGIGYKSTKELSNSQRAESSHAMDEGVCTAVLIIGKTNVAKYNKCI